jgi:thiol:disulfide interchange protein DsbD
MVAVKTALGVVLLLAALYFARPVLPSWAFTPWLAAPLLALGIWRGLAVRLPAEASRGKLALKAAGVASLVFGLYFGTGALIREGVPAPLVSGLYPDAVVPSPSRIEFRTDYEAALEEAREAGRPVMIDFVLPNCAGCRQLEEEVFSREDVAEEARRFETVRIDLADPPVPVERLKEEYRVFGAPTVVWLDSSGRIRHGLTVADGATPPEAFLERMREVN